jgi:UDP-N-acetyl-D-galactosamine dehydrogenase
VLGLTFKEKCPDLRNSRAPDIIRELESYGIEVAVDDPLADPVEAAHEYRLTLTPWENLPIADAVVIAVAHDAYKAMGASGIEAVVKPGGVVVDVKVVFAVNGFSGRTIWRL